MTTSVRSNSRPQQSQVPNNAKPQDKSSDNKSAKSASEPQDTVSLSGDDRDDAVDPNRQDAEVPNQQRELAERAQSGEDTENLRPATGQDALRYNALVQEADKYDRAGDYGNVKVSIENGVKRLQYDEKGGNRIVEIDENTGTVKNTRESPLQNSGMEQKFLVSSTTYERRGDVLGPVRQESGAVSNGDRPDEVNAPDVQQQLTTQQQSEAFQEFLDQGLEQYNYNIQNGINPNQYTPPNFSGFQGYGYQPQGYSGINIVA